MAINKESNEFIQPGHFPGNFGNEPKFDTKEYEDDVLFTGVEEGPYGDGSKLTNKPPRPDFKGPVTKTDSKKNVPMMKVVVNPDGTMKLIPQDTLEGNSMGDYKAKMAYILQRLSASPDRPEHADEGLNELFQILINNGTSGKGLSPQDIDEIKKKFSAAIPSVVKLSQNLSPAYEGFLVLARTLAFKRNELVGIANHLNEQGNDLYRTCAISAGTAGAATNDALRADCEKLKTELMQLSVNKKALSESITSSVKIAGDKMSIQVQTKVFAPEIATPKKMAAIELMIEEMIHTERDYLERVAGPIEIYLGICHRAIENVIKLSKSAVAMIDKPIIKLKSPSIALKDRLEKLKFSYEKIITTLVNDLKEPNIREKFPHLQGTLGEMREAYNKIVKRNDAMSHPGTTEEGMDETFLQEVHGIILDATALENMAVNDLNQIEKFKKGEMFTQEDLWEPLTFDTQEEPKEGTQKGGSINSELVVYADGESELSSIVATLSDLNVEMDNSITEINEAIKKIEALKGQEISKPQTGRELIRDLGEDKEEATQKTKVRTNVKEKVPASMNNGVTRKAEEGDRVPSGAHIAATDLDTYLDMVDTAIAENMSVERVMDLKGVSDPEKEKIAEIFAHDPRVIIPKLTRMLYTQLASDLKENISIEVKKVKKNNLDFKKLEKGGPTTITTFEDDKIVSKETFGEDEDATTREPALAPYRKKERDVTLTDPMAILSELIDLVDWAKTEFETETLRQMQAERKVEKPIGLYDYKGLEIGMGTIKKDVGSKHGHIVDAVIKEIKKIAADECPDYFEVAKKQFDFWGRAILAKVVGGGISIGVSVVKEHKDKLDPAKGYITLKEFHDIFDPIKQNFFQWIDSVVARLGNDPKSDFIRNRYINLKKSLIYVDQLAARAQNKMDPQQLAKTIEEAKKMANTFNAELAQLSKSGDPLFKDIDKISLDAIVNALNSILGTQVEASLDTNNLTKWAASINDDSLVSELKPELEAEIAKGAQEIGVIFKRHVAAYDAAVSKLSVGEGEATPEGKPDTAKSLIEDLGKEPVEPAKSEKEELALTTKLNYTLEVQSDLDILPSTSPNEMYSNYDLSENKLELREDGGKKKLCINKDLKNLVSKRLNEKIKGVYTIGETVNVDFDSHITTGTVTAYLGQEMYKVSVSGQDFNVSGNSLFKI